MLFLNDKLAGPRRHLAAAALFFAAALAPAAAFAQANTLYDLDAALANASAPISMSTATTAQIIAAPAFLEPGGGAPSIFINHFNFIAAGADNVTIVAGTGTNCATNQVNLTGAYPLDTTVKPGISAGSGFGPILVAPAGDAVCITTSAAVQLSGSMAYRIK